MRRSSLWLGVFGFSMILLPALAADDSNDAAAKPEANAKKQTDKLIKSGKAFIGKLVKVDADKRILTVEVPSPKQDPQVVQHLANLQRQLVDAQRHRNAVERAAQINRIQLEMEKASLNLYKKEKVEFDAPDEIKVRTMLLPFEFDDKGRPKRLTEKEKRELKGPDPSLPGYTADFDSLKPDQTVEIHLAKQPPKKAAAGRRSTDEKENDTDNTESSRPKIALIVIRAEARK